MKMIIPCLFRHLIGVFLLTLLLPSVQAQPSSRGKVIQITWSNSLSGDFSFRQQWRYPEGIYRNQFGQLCCDGLCPDGVSHMRDTTGKIYPEHLQEYYQLIDTTHQFYSIQSTTNSYEFSQTHFAKATYRPTKNIIHCYTLTNVATHSSLHLAILPMGCKANIQLQSIKPNIGSQTFACINGQIHIDKPLWKAGVLKATFDFQFYNHLAPKTPLYWKGKIFTRIVSID